MIGKMQITIILDNDVLAAVDRQAAKDRMGRSTWLDRWLAEELGLPAEPMPALPIRGGAAKRAKK